MSDDRHENERNPIKSDHVKGEISALEAAARYVAAGTATSGAGNGGGQAFSASFASLIEWGEAVDLIRSKDDFPCFGRRPDGYGDEHEAWFDPINNNWIKATYENRFGLAWGRKGSATAGEYLTRLVLQNQYFGDVIDLVALVNCGAKLRVLTSQPHVAGDPACYEEIQHWLFGLGFERFGSDGSIAWYRRLDNLLVADAHEGNVIRSSAGLFAIDVNIMKPEGEILKAVMSLIDGF